MKNIESFRNLAWVPAQILFASSLYYFIFTKLYSADPTGKSAEAIFIFSNVLVGENVDTPGKLHTLLLVNSAFIWVILSILITVALTLARKIDNFALGFLKVFTFPVKLWNSFFILLRINYLFIPALMIIAGIAIYITLSGMPGIIKIIPIITPFAILLFLLIPALFKFTNIKGTNQFGNY